MNNDIRVRVPSTKEMWGKLERNLRKQTKELTSTMAYYNADSTTYNIEDVEPMKKNCEAILQTACGIYEDIVEMYNAIREIDEAASPSIEEWFILQGEHERLEKNSL